MTLVVNLFGGPGSGKSTLASGIFCRLKQLRCNVELVTEYAKELVWEDNTTALDNQLYVFAQQHHRISRLLNKVDVIITDSPILLSMYYGSVLDNITFRKLVLEMHNGLDNFNLLLSRNNKVTYEPTGRIHTEGESVGIDTSICKVLNDNLIDYSIIEVSDTGIDNAAKMIYRMSNE